MSVSGPAIDTRVGRPTRLAGAIASIGEVGPALVIATVAVSACSP